MKIIDVLTPFLNALRMIFKKYEKLIRTLITEQAIKVPANNIITTFLSFMSTP